MSPGSKLRVFYLYPRKWLLNTLLGPAKQAMDSPMAAEPPAAIAEERICKYCLEPEDDTLGERC